MYGCVCVCKNVSLCVSVKKGICEMLRLRVKVLPRPVLQLQRSKCNSENLRQEGQQPHCFVGSPMRLFKAVSEERTGAY